MHYVWSKDTTKIGDEDIIHEVHRQGDLEPSIQIRPPEESERKMTSRFPCRGAAMDEILRDMNTGCQEMDKRSGILNTLNLITRM